MLGDVQDDNNRQPGMAIQVIDGRIQTLLLAFAAAPALEELHMQFRNGLSISGKCLVSVHLISFLLLPSSVKMCVSTYSMLRASATLEAALALPLFTSDRLWVYDRCRCT